MDCYFENTKLKNIAFGFLVFKLICTILYPLFSLFLTPFAFQVPWLMLTILRLADTSGAFAWFFFLITCGVFLSFLVCSLLLMLNKRGAGLASGALMVFCILDLLVMAPSWTTMALFMLIMAAFNLSIVFLLILLRRSGPDRPL